MLRCGTKGFRLIRKCFRKRKGFPQLATHDCRNLLESHSRTATHRETEINTLKPKSDCIYRISDWYGTKRMSVWFQINWIMLDAIWFRFDLMKFRKDFSKDCVYIHQIGVGFSNWPFDFGLQTLTSIVTWGLHSSDCFVCIVLIVLCA